MSLHKSEEEDFIVFMVNSQNTNYIPIERSKHELEIIYAIGSLRGLEISSRKKPLRKNYDEDGYLKTFDGKKTITGGIRE